MPRRPAGFRSRVPGHADGPRPKPGATVSGSTGLSCRCAVWRCGVHRMAIRPIRQSTGLPASRAFVVDTNFLALGTPAFKGPRGQSLVGSGRSGAGPGSGTGNGPGAGGAGNGLGDGGPGGRGWVGSGDVGCGPGSGGNGSGSCTGGMVMELPSQAGRTCLELNRIRRRSPGNHPTGSPGSERPADLPGQVYILKP